MVNYQLLDKYTHKYVRSILSCKLHTTKSAWKFYSYDSSAAHWSVNRLHTLITIEHIRTLGEYDVSRCHGNTVLGIQRVRSETGRSHLSHEQLCLHHSVGTILMVKHQVTPSLTINHYHAFHTDIRSNLVENTCLKWFNRVVERFKQQN